VSPGRAAPSPLDDIAPGAGPGDPHLLGLDLNWPAPCGELAMSFLRHLERDDQLRAFLGYQFLGLLLALQLIRLGAAHAAPSLRFAGLLLGTLHLLLFLDVRLILALHAGLTPWVRGPLLTLGVLALALGSPGDAGAALALGTGAVLLGALNHRLVAAVLP